MSNLNDIFQKAGGMKLLRHYLRAGVLIAAIRQFLITGRSRTGLEIVRQTVSLKIKEKLARKYKNVLNRIDREYIEREHLESRKLWVFWWQGMENAPFIVKRCHEELKRHMDNWDIVLITEHNYKDYVSFPEHILKKLDKGKITLTHFSDLLRLELLIRYGGLWLDATVLCTGSDIPMSIINTSLFVFQSQKPGADGKAVKMSSWLIYAKTNNKILMTTRELLYEYWIKNDEMIDYFLIHKFFSIAADRYDMESKLIFPFDNSIPHLLQLHLFDQYNAQWWEDWKKLTPFHKLSYKFSQEEFDKKGTFYDMLFNH